MQVRSAQWNSHGDMGKVTDAPTQAPEGRQVRTDSTFEPHYSIGDLAKQWRLGRETVRLLIKDEPGVLKIRLGRSKSFTRYSVPESVARRVHTKLFNSVG